ncbi:MAG: ABC-2 family transporter protein [Acidobacteriota bacterium]
MNRAGKHARILRELARIGAIRKSQLKVEFWSQVVMDTLWYTAHITVFEVLFRHTGSIAGWTRPEVRVFLGFLFVSDAFMMMWLGQVWHFAEDLKNGELDSVRVRPASPVIVYFFRSFSLEAGMNIAIAGSYLVFGLAAYPGALGPMAPLRVLWGLALTWWTQIVLCVLFSIPELYILNSDIGRFLRELFMAVEDRPLDIFTRRVKAFFLYVVPVGAMVQVPASLVLGRWSVLEGVAMSAFMVAAGFAVFALWKASFRRYESAMG